MEDILDILEDSDIEIALICLIFINIGLLFLSTGSDPWLILTVWLWVTNIC